MRRFLGPAKRWRCLVLVLLFLSGISAQSPKNPAFVLRDEPPEPLRPKPGTVTRSDVYDLKMRLSELGFYKGPLDEIYDQSAVDAVKDFQKSYWLEPNGVVDVTTWRALGHGAQRPASQEAGPLPEGELALLVDTETLTLHVTVGGVSWRIYPIAAGKWTDLTPVGEWKIVDKGYKVGGPYGSRWMALNVPWGNYGIHGTDRPWSVGHYASAGCVRMWNEDIDELYELVEIGTRVTIKGYLPALNWDRRFVHGSQGPEVVLIQERLRHYGFDPGYCDGMLGERTEAMMTEMRSVFGLGSGTWDLITLLGLGGGGL